MNSKHKPLIVLTNDDGIQSPGLVANAAALDPLGDLLIVAPHEQQSGTGRSLPLHKTGSIQTVKLSANGRSWMAYSADASPAQAVQHAVLELADRRPSLVVSGINFGENVGMGITISGTVGAALEAAAFGIPALAVSLQVDPALHIHFDDSVDFSVAAHFTASFARLCLEVERPVDVDVLKIEVPADATLQTNWQIARLERKRYYISVPPKRKNLADAGRFGYRLPDGPRTSGDDTDVAVLLKGLVAVTPLSLDMTSRVDFDVVRKVLNGEP